MNNMNTNYQNAFISGFVKAASVAGLTEQEQKQLTSAVFGKQAAEDGPFSIEQMAQAVAAEEKLKALIHNRKNHPAHYYLNPFVGGPITEGLTRLERRLHTGMSGKGGWSRTPAYGLPAIFSDKDAEREAIKRVLAQNIESNATGYPSDLTAGY